MHSRVFVFCAELSLITSGFLCSFVGYRLQMYELRKDKRSLCINREIDYRANICEDFNDVSVASSQMKGDVCN